MQEHFFAHLVRRELMHAVAMLPAPSDAGPRVLLAGAEDDQHDVGQLALWLLLREQGLSVMALGPDLRPTELVAAARQTRPTVVCLSGVTTASAPMLAAAARALAEARTGARVFVGGPAIAPPGAADSIPATALPQSVAGTLAIVSAAAER